MGTDDCRLMDLIVPFFGTERNIFWHCGPLPYRLGVHCRFGQQSGIGASMQRFWIILVSISALLLVLDCGRAEPDKPKPEPQKSDLEIGMLIKQLGSEVFDERETASNRLKELSVAAKSHLEVAATSKDPEVAYRAKELLAILRKEHENRGVVAVVGLYESRQAPAIVEITDTTRPIILVVCAYERVTWKIKLAEGVDLVGVIASGYHAQRVEGVDVPVTNFSYDEGRVAPDGKTGYFYVYDHDEENHPRMVAAVHALTGKKPKWFQGRYGFKKTPFVISAPE